MNHILYSDQEYQDLAQKIQMMVEEAEKLPHPYSKEIVFTLLQNFDMLHREALSRLLKMIDAHAPELREEMEADFAVHSLFALYDLFEDEIISPKKVPRTLGDFIQKAEQDFAKDRKPIWVPSGNISDLNPDLLYFKEFEGEKALLCKVEDEVFAFQSNCVGSALSLEFGTVKNHNLICPWHGCIYDVRTGELAGRPGEKLKLFPTSIEENGNFKIGFNH
ncbi:MAG: Rieske 2Fe-2S domain-containing protein [Chitinophagales bacterium]